MKLFDNMKIFLLFLILISTFNIAKTYEAEGFDFEETEVKDNIKIRQ
jgi:hypothetical protein